ncbi:PhzF family phenazine biosynthesis protein [Pseudocolwellia sp. HL-MZ19]|uniref:PhzF family phenazine biosynthesis protein n=1 Tax=Pseudocolwellia sp. HL-MZ19 TaxID=3400846 RepID=UPI003CF7CB09
MIEIIVYCINSFVYNTPNITPEKSGNPAGVVLNADKLTTQQMQYIATQVGYSETAFVSSDDQCDFNVRFFTPNNEVDFCGHATLAVFALLFKKNIITARTYSQHTKAGKLKVNIAEDSLVSMEQTLPQYLGEIDNKEVADLLNIPETLFSSTNLPCEIISTGLADVIIPVPFESLDSIIPHLDNISRFSEEHNAVGIHLFELPQKTRNNIDRKLKENTTISCRNFAPLFGISEESATGSACGALACYLTKHKVFDTDNYIFEQGKMMSSPSILQAKVHKTEGIISQVEVSRHGHIFTLKKYAINTNYMS